MIALRISSNIKNVVKISSGTIAGQLCSVVSLPIITRLYGPEVIGTWAIVNSLSGIVNTISDLGLTQSIMVCELEDLENQYRAVSLLNMLLCALTVPFVVAYCWALAYDAARIVLISIFTLAYAVTLQQVQINYTLLNRRKCYNVLMKNPLINQLVAAFVSIILGTAGFFTLGYYVGVTLGQVVTLAHMKRAVGIRLGGVSIAYCKKMLARDKDFVVCQMPANIAVQFRNQLPTLFIGSLFGTTVLGNYSVAQKLLNIPVTFVGQAIGNVFYQHIAAMRGNVEGIARFAQRNMRRAMLLAVLPMSLILALGNPLIVIVFGDGYELGGAMVGIVGFQSLFSFLTASMKGIDIVLGKQRYAMLAGIGQVTSMLLFMMLAYLATGDALACTTAMVLGFMFVQISYYCALYRYMNLNSLRYLIQVCGALLGMIVISGAIRLALSVISIQV